ncbi:MAG: heme exporter protein CcmB [Gammaproteobacteria bacterium]|jgi:heme exporter protein B|nr:heme exporter protein CcmB [Gammaproteobacteria bacterium]
MRPGGAGQAFTQILRRDVTLAMRRRGEWLNPVLFFVICVTLFPLGLGPEASMLSGIAPGVIWVTALLAAMLAMGGIFRDDYDDGSLEQLLTSPQPLSVLVLAKILAHWLVTAVPLILIAPILASALHLPTAALPALVATLVLGTPVLSLLGGAIAALTLAARRGTLLLPLLVLPLTMPVLIFATKAVEAAASGFGTEAQFSLLGALLMFSLSTLPFVTAGALRVGMGA